MSKLYGGERSDLASCPKSDRDLHVYVGSLPAADKGIFLFCPHGWFLQLPFLVSFIIKKSFATESCFSNFLTASNSHLDSF